MKWLSLFGRNRKKKRASPKNEAKRTASAKFNLEHLEERQLMANFSAGNLAVLRVGDGSTSLTSDAASVFIDEYTPTGAFVQAIALPAVDNGAQQSFTLTGDDPLEGGLSRSSDYQYLVFGGYDAAVGTTGLASSSSAAIHRILGRVGNSGVPDTSTVLSTAFDSGSIHSATSANGTQLWAAGNGANTTGGVHVISFGSNASVQLNATNAQQAHVFGNQLFVSTPTTGVSRLGSGLPSSGSPNLTSLFGGSSPGSFFLADLSATVAGLDTAYVADTAGTTIEKFSLDQGIWTSLGQVTLPSANGLTGVQSGSNITLYAVANNELIVLNDASGYNASFLASPVTLVGAPTNTAFRGIALAPIINQAPSAITDNNNATDQVAEGSANGTPVGITALSLDPESQSITYSLTDNAGGRFAINATTGIVSVANTSLIDFDTVTSHNITVRADDPQGNNVNQTFAIQVVNGAPTLPSDSNPVANFVYGGAANGTLVNLTASSTDLSVGNITYSLTDDAGGRFAIHSSTGVVSVVNGALLNQAGSHNITVRATDSFGANSTKVFSVTVLPSLIQTSTFQNGVSSYVGTQDTRLTEATPTTVNGNAGSITIDYPDANATNTSSGMLRFDSIFGNGPGQIPLGSRIASATLSLYTSNGSNDQGDGGRLHRMLVDWAESNATWASMNGGVSADGIEALGTYIGQYGNANKNGDAGQNLTISASVTADLQAWSDGTANYGWALLPWVTGTDGWVFQSSESATVAFRPKLIVSWLPPLGTASSLLLQNGNLGTSGDVVLQQAQAGNASFNGSLINPVFVDAANASNEQQVLLRFDNLTGSGPAQIPANAVVLSAYLTLSTTTGSDEGHGGTFYRMNADWTSADTWQAFGDGNGSHNSVGGIQPNGLEATTDYFAAAGNLSLTPLVQRGFNSFDVTLDVFDWQRGAAANYGWGILPWLGGTDGWAFNTSEDGDTSQRPMLFVSYNAQPTLNNIADQTADEDIVHNVTLTGISAGLSESQLLQITATSGNASLLANPVVTYTSGQNNATLSLLSASNQFGSTSVNVVVRDAGVDGLFNTADDNIITRSFNVSISPVNDAPNFSLLMSSPPAVSENAGLQTVPGFAGNFTPGPIDEANQTLVQYNLAVTGTTGSLAFSLSPSIAANGTLSYTPSPGTSGTANVTVSVTDSGNGTLPHVNISAAQTFTIVVSPGGNQFPSAITDSDATNNSVPEGAANGSTVGFSAHSIDPEGANITYSLADDAGGRFAINPSTGVITVANGTLLNFESASSHNVTIHASDGVNGVNAVSSTISIDVANVAPATPTDVDSANNTLLEGAANGSPVGITFSSFEPNGPNLTFSLSDDAGGRFAIDPVTGIVSVANGSLLNFESAATHNITVQVSDGVSFSAANLTINVQNVASATLVDSDSANNSISESAANGTPVGITASSSDPNGGFTYSLTNNAGGRFAIDPVNGVVTVANATLINFESAASHNITVQASDGTASVATDFTIAITNVRPTNPADTNLASNAVAPGAANGTLVGLTAFSSEPKGPVVVYSLTNNAGGRFAIDGSTGVVSVANSALITPGTYSITVQADEGAGAPSTSNFLINVPVVPVQTLAFQQGVNNGFGTYSGTDDVQLSASSANTTAPSGTSLLVDFDAAKAVETHALLRFNNIVGAAAGQIPANAIILDATLALFTNNPGAGGSLHRMQQTWSEANATWASANGGISADGIEAATSFNAQVGNSDRNGDTVDQAFTLVRVTQDVQAWVNGETNNGWAILPWLLGTDGWAFDSSEGATAARRPMLVVNYILPGSASVIDLQQGNNGYNGTVDTSLNGDTPGVSYGGNASYFVDAVGVTNPSQVLLRFDNLVGSGTNQVPVNSTVYGAVLSLASTQGNAPGDGGELYRLNGAWTGADTWDSFGDGNGSHNAQGGVQPDGAEASTTALAIAGAASLSNDTLHGQNAVAVTADVQAWVSGQTNNGWAILPWADGGDGWGYRASESTDILERPLLRVVFNAAPTVAAVPGQNIDEDSSANVSFTGVSAGLAETQSIQVTATSGNTSLLLNPTVNYTSGQGNGTLTLTPAANQVGTTSVTLTVRDAGIDGVFNTADDAVTTTNFSVTVTPINDAPSFTLAGNPPIISENAGLQTVTGFAGNFNPGQPDEMDTLLQYNVSVTSVNGTLTFAAAPTIASNGTLTYTPTPGTSGIATVSVTVSDSGNGTAPHANTSLAQTFQIFVSPGGNQFPSLPTDVNAANNTVAEGAPNGTPVGITAQSVDPEGANVTYSLADSAGGRFAIDPVSGVVSIANAGLINFESASSHNITVQATEGTNFVSAPFSINIANVAPTLPIDADTSPNTVTEGASNGSAVGVIAASTDPNSNVTYTLTDNAGGRFAIDSNTGVVSVANAALINFESATSHSITAQVSDGAGGTSNQTFSVNVANVAPSTPLDANAAANRVAPGAPNGTLVGITVSSNEPNGPAISYSLTSNASGRFAINSSTGVVTLANRNLLVPGTTYTITAQADDGGGSPTSTNFQIEVPYVFSTSFQQGVDNGFGVYSGTEDVQLTQTTPNTPAPSGASLLLDYPDASNEAQILLRFDSIIGSALGQIPANAIIVDATLSLYTNNPGDGGSLHRMEQSWSEATATWNLFTAGIQNNGSEAAATFNAIVGNPQRNTDTTDVSYTQVRVTDDVQAWVNGSVNNGWAFLPWVSGTDGWAIVSSEGTTLAQRPSLSVSYILPGSASVLDLRQGVNGYNGTVDTMLQSGSNTSQETTVNLSVNGTTPEQQVLLQFSNLVGTGANQIPGNSLVYAASLTLAGTPANTVGDGGQFFRMKTPWAANDTFSALGNGLGGRNATPGVQADGLEAAASANFAAGTAALTPDTVHGFTSFDARTDVQAWVGGAAVNYGWAILPWVGSNDNWIIRSSDTVANQTLDRPDLRVIFNAPPTLTAIPDMEINLNAGEQTINLTGISAGLAETQTLQFSVGSANQAIVPQPAVSYAGGANGTLAFTPTAAGLTAVTVNVRDAGLDGVLGNFDDVTTNRTFLVQVNDTLVATTTTLLSSANPAELGANVTFTAAVSSTGPTPTGNVTFMSGAAVLGNGTLSGAGLAMFTTASLPVGSYPVTAVYTGDAAHSASTSTYLTQSVNAPLQVLSVTPTTTGFDVQFNRSVAASVVNLYDQGHALGAADVTLVGQTSGIIKGSLVFNAASNGFRFVSTGAVLAPDLYQFTLRSATDGFKDLSGNRLRDVGGVNAGNYVGTFTITAPAMNAVTVSLPDFARGYGQSVNVPAAASGLPITLSSGLDVTSVQFTLRYDPALLNVTGVSTALAGANATLNVVSPGVAQISVTSATEFASSAGSLTVATLVASVPDTATYGGKHVLDIANLLVLDDQSTPQSIAALDKDAVHVAAYFGDTDGSQAYNSPDALAVQQVTAGMNSGFAAYQTADPRILGDINGNGAFNGPDYSLLQSRVLGNAVTFIPALPTGLTPPAASGLDPKLFIDKSLAAVAGESVSVPVQLTVTENAGITVGSVDLTLQYDAEILKVEGVLLGSLLTDNAASSPFSLAFNTSMPGLLRISITSAAGTRLLPFGTTGALVNVLFSVASSATAGTTSLNLVDHLGTTTRLFDAAGRSLLLSPAPTNADSDEVDGALHIARPSEAILAALEALGRSGESGEFGFPGLGE